VLYAGGRGYASPFYLRITKVWAKRAEVRI